MKDFKRYTLESGVENFIFPGSGLYYLAKADSLSSLIVAKYNSFQVYGDQLDKSYDIRFNEGKGYITYKGEGTAVITIRKIATNY